MEKIEFVHNPDCRACVLEIRDASKRKLERIIAEREKLAKCKGCVRLEEVRKRHE